MIKSIEIDNFKSLVNFKLENLTGFTCLIGLNGAGKTTFLQALDFLSQLMRGEMNAWLKSRGWKSEDLASKWLKSNEITFAVTVVLKEYGEVKWSGVYDIESLRCKSEKVVLCESNIVMLSQDGDSFKMKVSPTDKDAKTSDMIYFNFTGSLLSQMKLDTFGLQQALKDEITSYKSLDMLNPERMRKPGKISDDVGKGGELLAPYIYKLDESDKMMSILRTMVTFYPTLSSIYPVVDDEGDVHLNIVEHVREMMMPEELKARTAPISITSDANHINDGMLRILTIIAETYSENNTILYDEIENGINPEIIERLVDFLVQIEKQTIVTTHSPMILNYLEDDVAKESVVLLYKDDEGHTKATRFFDMKDTKKKLRLLGPGEVFVDTSIPKLVEMIQEKDA